AEDPARTAAARDLRRAIDEEINALSEKLRLPFLLCEVEGRCRASAAAELGCPGGTVEARLSRARARRRPPVRRARRAASARRAAGARSAFRGRVALRVRARRAGGARHAARRSPGRHTRRMLAGRLRRACRPGRASEELYPPAAEGTSRCPREARAGRGSDR